MILTANGIRGWIGPKFSRHVLQLGENPDKIPQLGKLTRPGIEPGPAG